MHKKIKQIGALMFGVCVLLQGYNPIAMSELESNNTIVDVEPSNAIVTNRSSVYDAYESFLNNLMLADGETAQYTVWDINNDNVSELMVSISDETEDLGYVDLYTRNGSEIVEIHCADHPMIGIAATGESHTLKYYNGGLINIVSDSSDSESVGVNVYGIFDNYQMDEPQWFDDVDKDSAAIIMKCLTPTWFSIDDMTPFESHRLLAEEQASFTNSCEDFYGKTLEEVENEKIGATISNEVIQTALENSGCSLLWLRQHRIGFIGKCWSGACYGIATTMVLSSLDRLDIQKYDETATTFSQLYDRSQDKTLSSDVRDIMNYYQLLQYVPGIEDSAVTVERDGDLQMYLTNLVERAKLVNTEGAVVMGLNWENEDNVANGHEIVVNGYTGGEDGSEYELEIIDSNQITPQIKMIISADYSSFYFIDSLGAKEELNNWTEMSYYDSLDIFNDYNIDDLM